jgi:glutathione S-transferase
MQQISMAGGRSLAEKSLTNKQLFRDIREKINTAAKIPGFFEVGDGQPEMQLYCKSNRDGTQIGDCPFAQFIQMVLMKKGIKYTVIPTLPTNKPAWLVEKFEGKLPVLVHNDVSLTDSLTIAEYIEKKYPHSSLTRQGAFSYQEVLEKTANFFPILSSYIKNKDSSKDAELLSSLELQFDILDEIIRSTPGKHICGIEITLADLYLVPLLYHAMVTLEHFKGQQFYHIDGEATRPALENYLSRMLDTEEFNDKRAYYNIDQVVFGWKVARGDVVIN